MKTCCEPGCDRPARARDRCDMHYRRHLKSGAPPPPRPPAIGRTTERCAAPRCRKVVVVRGYCKEHYMERYRRGVFSDLKHHRRLRGAKIPGEPARKCRPAILPDDPLPYNRLALPDRPDYGSGAPLEVFMARQREHLGRDRPGRAGYDWSG